MPRKRTKFDKKNEDEVYASEASNIPRCFVCDDRIRGKGVQLVMGRTPYSNTGLPAKIGQLIGEDFMVVVCLSDMVCARCTGMISQLDKLENDMHYIKKTLTGYLASKYNLNHEAVSNKSGSSTEATKENVRNEPSNKRGRLNSEPHPNPASILLASRSKVKQYGCENCSFTTSDSDALLPHYSACARLVHHCSLCPARFETSSSLAQHKRQAHSTRLACHTCSLNFDNEQDYSNHTKIHLKKTKDRCSLCNFTSSDKTVLDNHICSHSIQLHQCPVCRLNFAAESSLESHMASHHEVFKCRNCQAAFKQKKNLEDHQRFACKVSSSMADSNPSTSDGTQGDTGLSDDLSLENLIKVDGVSSSDSIEFYSCQSCALTFLNKMLFTEHMKMHLEQPEKNTLDKGEISDAHAEILKSASASVSGVCHIDDDLEDLFEKLHAETTNSSSLMPSSDENKASDNPCDETAVHRGSDPSAHVDGDGVSQSTIATATGASHEVNLDGLQNSSSLSQGMSSSEMLDSNSLPQTTIMGTSTDDSHNLNSTMLCHSKLGSGSIDSSNPSSVNLVVMNRNELGDNNSLSMNIVGMSPNKQVDDNATSLGMLAMNCSEQDDHTGPVVNMDHDQADNTNSIGTIQEDSNQAIVSMAVMDPSQQQTLIYISSGDGLTDGDQQGMVLHNATIDPSSGNIQLLQYVIDDTDNSPDDVGCSSTISVDMESEGNFQEQNQEQNFCKMKPEPGLAEKNPNDVRGANDSAYMCAQCGFQTSILIVLKRHLKAHQDNQVHQCSICNRVFSSTQRLLSHLDTHADNDGPVKCPFCFIELENCSLLLGHTQEQHPEEKQCFRCRFCDRKFSSKRSCSVHEETHTEIFVFPCVNCGKKLPSEEELDDHINKYHRTNSKCRYCEKVIDNPRALRSHEQRHMQESNHHECSVCKRVFKTKTGLRHHGAIHTGEFKYCCDFCGRGFMSRMMLEEHRSRHTKEERYICDVCGRKFTFQSTYWIHRKWHDNPYPYKCNFCGRMFRHTSLLAVHKRKHTGERPYKCPHCPMSFPVGGTLKRHLILHTGVYPYNCESCKRGFTTKHKYASHLAKVHGDFDLVNHKPLVKDFKMVVHEPMKEGSLDTAESWELMDDLSLVQVDDSNVDDAGTVIADDDLMPSDNVVPTRVVEIVMDDAYQAVATVTLAEVSEGGDANIIPDMWYQ